MFSKIVTDDDLAVAVNTMREANTDLADYEIKDAKGGFPSSVVDSMVAFANTSGGVVILGISEKTFDSVDVDVKMLQSQLAQAARDRISPSIMADILYCITAASRWSSPISLNWMCARSLAISVRTADPRVRICAPAMARIRDANLHRGLTLLPLVVHELRAFAVPPLLPRPRRVVTGCNGITQWPDACTSSCRLCRRNVAFR